MLPHSDHNNTSGSNQTVGAPVSLLDLTSTGNAPELDVGESSDFGDEAPSREEKVIQFNSQPHGLISPTDMPEVSTLNQNFDSQIRLPTRFNCGVPAKRCL
jgi:hypothetical protein